MSANDQIRALLRPHILKLAPYASARDEFTGEAQVFLDANENPIGAPIGVGYNRYPDPLAKELKVKLAKLYQVDAIQIFVGHGSDEGIDLLVRAFCEPGKDSIVICPPTYGMYRVAAEISAISVISVPQTTGFKLDLAGIAASKGKLLFICSPNNPTGKLVALSELEQILEVFAGVVVVDEAYIEFSEQESAATLLAKYPRLAVLRTLSKGWGVAGLRVGAVLAHPEIINTLNRIKPPYNLSLPSQQLALKALSYKPEVARQIAELKRERERLTQALAALPNVREVQPSAGNFLLVRVMDVNESYQQLLQAGVVVRNRSHEPLCDNCLRITIGTRAQNDQLLAVLAGQVLTALNRRAASCRRHTAETNILVELDLDGQGRSTIHSGVGFLDHMLTLFAKHSGINLTVQASGDLEVDEHHTIEDAALTLGQALNSALGEKRGINRYGFWLPMDEADAAVTLDLAGRPYLVWRAQFSSERVGDFPLQMAEHFFKSLADAARLTLHIEAKGANDHHIIEAIFKAFARALRSALQTNPNSDQIPSTKGVL